jgi:hypothetical protein
MITFLVDYATPSAYESTRDKALLGLSANCRRPVRFHGRVDRHIFLLRLALRTLGEVIWSSDTWVQDGAIMDPVITVHDDRIFFEAFSADQSAYGMVIIDPSIFEPEGEIRCGTTNVDFTAWLWAALGELRTNRETWLRIEPEGFEVKTGGAGGRYEQKVELPAEWVRGFLQLQGAMAMAGTRITARPVDLLAALRYLRYTKARVSPRALRYEFLPGEVARLVLEPWEHIVELKGSEHNYAARHVIRTWGRRRLSLIEPLLPFADEVEIYLKGRALPSFYAVKMKDITLVLGLTGWSQSRWTDTAGFDMLAGCGEIESESLSQSLEFLQKSQKATVQEIAAMLKSDMEKATRALTRLCRQGRVTYDVQQRVYRHRELFETPPDEDALFPPDPRKEKALEFMSLGKVEVKNCVPRETKKMKRLKTPQGKVEREVVYHDWHISGHVAEEESVEIVLDDAGRIIFGTCGCPFFRENLLNRGPCEHMFSLFACSSDRRKDLPTSRDLPSADGGPQS